MASNNRINYIDILRGVTILWVVAYHLKGGDFLPSWISVTYRMPMFFFLSGMFFRYIPFKEFFVKRFNVLIIPFAFWLLVTWLYIVLKYELVVHFFPTIGYDYSGPTWGAITEVLGLFNLSNVYVFQPLLNNGPLWFLPALFLVQLIFYGIRTINRSRYLWVALAVACYVLGTVMENYGINGMFFMSQALCWLLYYVLGNIVGLRLAQWVELRISTVWVLPCCIPFLLAQPFVSFEIQWINTLWLFICSSAFTVFAFWLFCRLERRWKMNVLKFFGANSLAVLVTHVLMFMIIKSFVLKFMTVFANEQELLDSNGYYIILYVTVCFVSYFVIKFCNRYIPWAVGKQPQTKLLRNKK